MMTLSVARRIANDIQAGEITAADWPAKRDDIQRAFHRLDNSKPATPMLRQHDLFLAKVIWRFVGRMGR